MIEQEAATAASVDVLPTHADALPAPADVLPAHVDVFPTHADALPAPADVLPANCNYCSDAMFCHALDNPVPTHDVRNLSLVRLFSNGQELEVGALVDTGCTTRNFISPRLAAWLTKSGKVARNTSGHVCTAYGNCKELSSKYSDLDMQFYDYVNNKYDDICFTASVLDMKSIDLVIGLPTIVKYRLASRMIEARFERLHKPQHLLQKIVDFKFPLEAPPTRPQKAKVPFRSCFKQPIISRPTRNDENDGSDLEGLLHNRKSGAPLCGKPASGNPDDNCALCSLRSSPDSTFLNSIPSVPRDKLATSSPCESGCSRHEELCHSCESRAQLRELPLSDFAVDECALCALRVHKSDLIDSEPEADEISEPHALTLEDLVAGPEAGDELNQIPGPEQIHGSPSMQKAITDLCIEFKSIFSKHVRSDAARVTPMTLSIKKDKTWSIPASRRAPRPQSPEKMAALKTMIEELLRLRVIKASAEAHASQVLLVVKKETKALRFCIDYRELNDMTDLESWPIPNIAQLLERLGARQSKYFGVMDLTSGYHQAPLDGSASKFTAFVTAMGIYEWNRVPMGLKGAGSYFQRMMVTEVLRDCIYTLCEVYLDDVIVFGTTEAEYLTNLRKVFTNLKTYNITLNPKKCKFGLKEVEYVGHVINEHGKTFTRTKLDSVVNFPKPETHAQMLSFLGLANYFRSHINMHSTVAKPLHDLVVHYKKNQKIVWNPEADAAFATLKDLIDKCPMLYFLTDVISEIIVQTDASNDGIGAYIFQRIQNPDGSITDRPIEFISKSFSREQRRWSTAEQEAYAIFYALRKFDYLLRDVKFTIQTDHKNLIYINTDGSAKVKRWKLLVQEYDFDIVHIPGVDNPIADAFSRLCGPDGEPFLYLRYLSVSPARAFAGMFASGFSGKDDRQLVEMFNLFLEVTDREQREEERHWVENRPSVFRGYEQFWGLDDVKTQTALKERKRRNKLPPVTVLPIDIHDKIMKCHNAMTGHSGVNRTMGKLRKSGVDFPQMRESVTLFIKECPFCQKASYKKVKAITLPFVLGKTKTMTELYLDTIGPLTKDSEGYQYVLTAIDSFTRWVMLYPLRTLEAQECALALIQHFGIFGVPKEITSDGGTQFNNNTIQEIIQLVGGEYAITLAYSHQDNSIVERANKTVVHYIRGFLFDKGLHNPFRIYLPFVQRIMNSEVISSIGVSAAQCLFGNAIDLDRGILTPHEISESHDHSSMTEFVKDLIKVQKAILKYAASVQEGVNSEHLLQRTGKLQGEPTHFAKGTHVLMSYENALTGSAPNKLMMNLKGPLKVVSNVGANYELLDMVTGRPVKAHVSRLREFKYNSQLVKPIDIAIKDSAGTQIVESVIGHRGFTGSGTQKLVSNLELNVRYTGDLLPTWQPWKNFYNNEVAHAYMNRIPYLKRILNKSYQEPDPEPDPAVPVVPKAAPRPKVIQPPAPAVVMGDHGLKRVLEIEEGDQAAPLTRNEEKRAKLQQIINNAQEEIDKRDRIQRVIAEANEELLALDMS